MWKLKSFFASFSRGTKIIWTACGCFILLTMLILTFLMLCPIQTGNSYAANDALIVSQVTTGTALSTSEESTTLASSTRRTTTTADETTVDGYENDADQTYTEVENNWYDDSAYENRYDTDNDYSNSGYDNAGASQNQNYHQAGSSVNQNTSNDYSTNGNNNVAATSPNSVQTAAPATSAAPTYTEPAAEQTQVGGAIAVTDAVLEDDSGSIVVN